MNGNYPSCDGTNDAPRALRFLDLSGEWVLLLCLLCRGIGCLGMIATAQRMQGRLNHVNNTSWFSQALFLASSSSIITEKASSLCIFGESGHIYIKGSKF